MKKLLLSFSLIASFTAVNAQWTSQETGFTDASRGLSEIKIVDANTVWALAYDGSGLGANVQEFTRTTNGGTTWTAGVIDMDGNASLEINNISPVSGDTAWVSALVPADGNGVVYKTTDGGQVWSQQLANGFTTTGQSFLNGVYFWNANVGVAYGDPTGSGASRNFEIYRTTNGGDTWTRITGSALPSVVSGEYGYNSAPTVVGNTIWFTTDHGRLIRSTDMGLTWTGLQSPLGDFGGSNVTGTSGRVYFSDANNGFLLKITGSAAPFTYSYYTTSNGGQTWAPASATTFTGTRYILNYIPGTTTIVATSQASPVGTSVSTNNGATWTDVETGDQRGASAFLNATTGWCAGFSDGDILGNKGIFKLTGQLSTANPALSTKFKVYPNPATSVVNISVNDVDSYNVSVTDLSGKTVINKSLSGVENTLDISDLATGTYFFTLSSGNNKEVVKILKN